MLFANIISLYIVVTGKSGDFALIERLAFRVKTRRVFKTRWVCTIRLNEFSHRMTLSHPMTYA